MLTLTAQVVNVLEIPKGKRKDGTEYDGYHQVQMMVEEARENGQKRMELLTMSTDHPEAFQKLTGQHVSLPVRAYSKLNTYDVKYQITSDAKPHPVK